MQVYAYCRSRLLVYCTDETFYIRCTSISNVVTLLHIHCVDKMMSMLNEFF